MHALEKLLGTPGEQKIKFKIFSGADQSPAARCECREDRHSDSFALGVQP